MWWGDPPWLSAFPFEIFSLVLLVGTEFKLACIENNTDEKSGMCPERGTQVHIALCAQ